jgi:hypothetical protein
MMKWQEGGENFIVRSYVICMIRMIKSRRMRLAGHVAQMERRNLYRLLLGKSVGMRPLGRPRCRWLNNIKMDLGERLHEH